MGPVRNCELGKIFKIAIQKVDAKFRRDKGVIKFNMSVRVNIEGKHYMAIVPNVFQFSTNLIM